MTIIKEKQFDDLNNERFNLEVELEEKLIEEKDEAIAQFKQERD